MKGRMLYFVVSVAVAAMIAGLWVWEPSVVSASISLDEEPVLIIDAGHGGVDGGASAASGHKESDINLSVSLKLAHVLAFCGKAPVLTRTEDVSLHDENCTTIHEKKVSDLNNRIELIKEHHNALLISVHQNYFTDPRYKGFQVFYSVGDSSRQWAERTQELMRQALSPDNGRKARLLSDDVYLFRHIECPSILVECGFLSNGEETALLLNDGYQKKLAVALAVSCMKQLSAMERDSGGV